MKILGIETSCDETAVCIIESNGSFEEGDFSFAVLGNSLLSQAEKHAEYGGVYPNLAKREHARNLVPILQTAFKEADMLIPAEKFDVKKEQLDEIRVVLEREPELFSHLAVFLAQYAKPDINAIAVTVGPGLEPALWVGVNFARALSRVWNIPIVPINHMEGHIIISLVQSKNRGIPKVGYFGNIQKITFPTLALLISGGHTELVLMKEWMSYEKIGQTRDDAVGEAFDKTARLLGLPYPGGPEISRLARKAREENLEQPFSLPRPMIASENADFSFSGLKTAVRKLIGDIGEPTEEQKMQIAREFEDAVADVFVSKVSNAIEEHNVHTLILGGGVSANAYIKTKIGELLKEKYPNVAICVSPPENATDNALMIALAGHFHARLGDYAEPSELKASGTLSLA